MMFYNNKYNRHIQVWEPSKLTIREYNNIPPLFGTRISPLAAKVLCAVGQYLLKKEGGHPVITCKYIMATRVSAMTVLGKAAESR